MKLAWRLSLALGAACMVLAAADGPEQPLPFSHKAHAGDLKLQCKMCHPNPNPGESMTIAGPPVCMQCHSAIKTDSPAIQKLAAYAKEGKPVPWVRIYEIPSYVNFSHRSHLQAQNTCADCHGKVAERDRLYREIDLNMGTCMNCHAARKASVDCGFCHDPR
ncbi:MAG: cytochrome c3 family protein [Bryobacteraceae bacterium]